MLEIIAIVVSVISLTAAIVAIILAFPRGAGAGIVRYTITGAVEVVNDCDGIQASIPTPVKIKSSLNDNRGLSSGSSITVNLAPDPADPAGTPRLIGTYSITVAWGPGLGNPTQWDTPVATKPDDTDICRSINCPAGTLCDDRATRPRIVPFSNPNTNYDVRVGCTCT